MSKITKRKHVTREVLEEFFIPEGDQEIVKVLGGRGNNLHEVQTAGGEVTLASMPSKFRKNVWIKRGDFVVTEPIAEGSKVKAEIVMILYPEQVKHIKEEGKWPEAFSDKKDEKLQKETETSDVTQDLKSLSIDANQKEHLSNGEEDYSSESDNDDDLFVNTNHPTVTYYYSDDTDEEGSEEDEEAEEEADEESTVDN